MKITKTSKLIKPQTPTSQNLKNYNISFIDQFMEPMNFAVILFYQSNPENNTHLEESLAQVLVQFYPLAGRYIKNDHLVDCSDQGVEFVEAEALDVDLADLVGSDQLDDLLPDQYFKTYEAPADPLLSIQATHFHSGGVAIAISVSHRVFDISSLGTFVTVWSNATNLDRIVGFGSESAPSFHVPDLLPYMDLGLGINSNEFILEAEKAAVKRLVFDKEAIASMRLKLRPTDDGKTVSRVRIVCAVISKALIGIDRAKHGKDRDFFMIQLINMRERTIPPQPKHVCGNFSIPSHTRRLAASEAKDLGIQEVVDVISDSVGKSLADYARILDKDGRGIILNALGNITKQVFNPEVNAMAFSDWSKFGFYEVDFGWGKPVWTSTGPIRSFICSTVLMSNKEGDGIEAWVYLNPNDMHYLEQDEDIKLFMA